MTDPAANLEYLAERLWVPCPKCRGSGVVPCECVFDSTPHSEDKCDYRDCESGKKYLLRVKCVRHWWSDIPCDTCGMTGEQGYTPVTDMALILEAIRERGWGYRIMREPQWPEVYGDWVRIFYNSGKRTIEVSEGDELFGLDALALAVRRALEATE